MIYGCSPALKTYTSIDWLSATIKHDNRMQMNFLTAFDDLYTRKEVIGLHGYNRGLKWENGAMAFWHTEKKEMGVHIQLSGDPLRSLEQYGYDPLFLLNRLVTAKAKFTRVDIALDVVDSALQIEPLYQLFKAKEYSGRSQSASMIDHTVKGTTMYVGSWDSARFYRVYDKQREMKLKGVDWKRVELVLKDKYARSFVAQYGGHGTIEYIGKVMKGTVKAMAEMKDRTWIDILDGETEKVSLPKEIPNDTRKWLLTQVCPAIANHIIRHDDTGILDDMQNEITSLLKKKWK